MKYENSSTHFWKVSMKVKVFKKCAKLQDQGHRVKYWYSWKDLVTRNTHVWDIKALECTVQNLLARFKFSKVCQTQRSKDKK